MKRYLLWAVGALAVLYVAAGGWIYWLMHRPPGEFAKGFGRMPMVSMVALPFESMWLRARAGHVSPGDPAPEFNLPMLKDKTTRVSLAGLRGRPVLLVFGSYT